MDVHTLQDLAEHCYKKWMTTDKISLPTGSIEWIREDLGEQKLAEEISKIYKAGLQGSEKCYRFLKLTGVIDRDRLRKLLKKQVLDEIEYEKVFKIENLEIDFQNKVNEQRRRLLNNPNDEGLPTWLLMIIAALVVGGIGILVGSKIGWSIGVLVGAGATFIYRMMRMSELIGQFEREAEPGLDIQRESVESGTRDKKTHIDEAVINLEKLYSGPLVNRDKEENITVDIVTAPNAMRYFMWSASIVLALMIVPVFISSPKSEAIKVQDPINNNECDEGCQMRERAAYKAVVNQNEAVFTFPINPQKQYKWCPGGLQYAWNIRAHNNNSNFKFGFSLFTPMGATPCGEGNFSALLDSGQFSVWRVTGDSASVVENIKVEHTVSNDGQFLNVILKNKEAIKLIFSDKPAYVSFQSQVLEKKSSKEVAVIYEINSNESNSRKAIEDIYRHEPYEYECQVAEVDKQINKFEEFTKQFPDSIYVPEALAKIAWMQLYALQCPISRPEKLSRYENAKSSYKKIFTGNGNKSWGITAKELYDELLRDDQMKGLSNQQLMVIHDKLMKQIPLCKGN